MRNLTMLAGATVAAILFSASAPAPAQSTLNLDVLRGLAPFSALLNTAAGKAALQSNYVVTASIQSGAAHPPTLEPFADEEQRAIKDAYITGANAAQLADGLGTALDRAYTAAASYSSSDDGATEQFTNVSPNVAQLIAFTAALSGADSGVAKTVFADGTISTHGSSAPASADAVALLTAVHGSTDVYGKAYKHPAGSAGADPYGDSRPFQTEPTVRRYSGLDYFGVPATNTAYLDGPVQNLTKSPAFPSGHTTYGYTESLLLAIMVPERYPQMMTRAAEYGYSRIILGAHYAMDVIAGRTLAEFDVAHLLAGDPAYLAFTTRRSAMNDYRATLASARADLVHELTATCGATIAHCAAEDTSRFADPAKDEAFYESTLTYGLATVYPATAETTEDVAKIAPQAGYLLTAAFPSLSLAQADQILTATEGPGGGFLDNGSEFGLYSRLDLYRAAKAAAATHA